MTTTPKRIRARGMPGVNGSPGWALLLGLAVLVLPGTASAAQPGFGDARGTKSHRYSCRPPLKFAAGACVRRCPAGYRDTGRYCRFRNMSR